MTKLTKTQQALIDIARKHGGCWSVETCSGRGAYGGRISHGARERSALFALVEMGIAEITQRQPWEDYNRGNRIGGTVFAFRLKGE